MGKLKDENNALLSRLSEEVSASGWSYTKTGTLFRKKICKGVTLQFSPNLAYTMQGGIAIAQPHLFLRSSSFEKEAARIFGFKTRGPLMLNLSRPPATLPGLPKEFQERFSGHRAQFLEMETPDFPSHKGYFENTTLPFFVKSLLACADHFARAYTYDTEFEVLKSLPGEFFRNGSYGAVRLGGITPFVLTQIMLGHPDVLERLKSDKSFKINPGERKLLAQLEAATSGVLTLG